MNTGKPFQFVERASGLEGFGIQFDAGVGGVTAGTAKDTLLANYNNLENVKALFEANKNEIAAIIVEPVAGNMGCIPPKDGFLSGLKELCKDYKIMASIFKQLLLRDSNRDYSVDKQIIL
jgi:glutamate-1-semialdehyde aminotransferase